MSGRRTFRLIDIFNKCDRLEAAERARLAAEPGALCVSALDR